MKKKLIVILLSVIVIAAGIVFVLYSMGDRIIEEAIMSDIELSNTSEEKQAADTETPEEASSEATANSNEPTVVPDKLPEKLPVNADEKTPDKSKPTLGPQKGDVKKPSGKIDNNSAKKAVKDKKVISVNKMNEIKNEVAPADKIAAATLVLKRLTPEDINELKDLAAGGLSEAEKEKAKQIAYSRFTKEEINEIKEMYRKYMN